MKPIVYMLCGLTGSGKTTYAKRLVDGQTVRLSIDEFIFDRHGHYGVDYPEPEYAGLYGPAVAEMKRRLAELLRAGTSVLLDFGFWTRAQREEFKRAIEENGGRWELWYFKADEKTLEGRLELRNRRQDANSLTVTREALRDFMSSFEEPHGEGEIVVSADAALPADPQS